VFHNLCWWKFCVYVSLFACQIRFSTDLIPALFCIYVSACEGECLSVRMCVCKCVCKCAWFSSDLALFCIHGIDVSFASLSSLSPSPSPSIYFSHIVVNKKLVLFIESKDHGRYRQEEGRCQFHQHFFVQIFCTNILSAAFSNYVLALAKKLYEKRARKTVMKSTVGVNFTNILLIAFTDVCPWSAKKTLMTQLSFCAFWIWACKSCAYIIMLVKSTRGKGRSRRRKTWNDIFHFSKKVFPQICLRIYFQQIQSVYQCLTTCSINEFFSLFAIYSFIPSLLITKSRRLI